MAVDIPPTCYEVMARNRWRTVLLLALFPVMLAAITLLGSLALTLLDVEVRQGDELLTAIDLFLAVSPIVGAVGTVWIGIMLLSGKRMVLAFAGAKPVTKKDAPELYRIVENLSIRTGITMPKLYVIDDPSLNAFATGYTPNRAAVAVTKGILEKLDKPELEAVLAHEFGHVLNRDTRVMLIAIAMVGILQMLSEIIIRGIFHSQRGSRDRKGGGPILLLIAIAVWLIGGVCAVLVQLGISRKREYLADAQSAYLTRDPLSLASALQKISADPRVEVLDGKRTAASLCIADPLETTSSFVDGMLGLFRSHPPIADRIRLLKGMGGTAL